MDRPLVGLGAARAGDGLPVAMTMRAVSRGILR